MWLKRLSIALVLLVAFTACKKKVPVTMIPPPPSVTALPDPPPVTLPSPPPLTTITVLPSPTSVPDPPLPPPEIVAIQDAGRRFEAGDYVNAAAGYQDYLRLAPQGDQRDRALFQLGVLYALPEFVQRDWQKAVQNLTELVTKHPQSPLTPMAHVVLGLRSEITALTTENERRDQRVRQLTTELDRLKKIDSERRTR